MNAERKISLAAVSNFPGAQAPAAISGIKLLLLTPDSLTLGYVPSETGNEAYKLVAEGKDNQWLDTLILKRYGGRFSPKGKSLLWLIRSLSITTDTTGLHYFARLKAEVYTKKAVGSCQKLFETDTVLAGQLANNTDYTTGILKALDELYQTSLTEVEKQAGIGVQSVRADAVEQTEDSIVLLALKESNFPVLKGEAVIHGVYATYEEFTRNTPGITGDIWAEPDTTLGSGHVKLFVMSADSTVQQLTNIWGICFGGNEVYKYEDGLLVPIERAGSGFVLSRYQPPATRRNQALYWRRIAAYGWPDDTNPFSRKQTLTLKRENSYQGQQPVATRIDMSTGELTF